MSRATLRATDVRIVADVIATAYADPDLDRDTRCALLALCAAAQRAGRLDLLPSGSRLGASCGCKAPAARRLVNALRRRGYLTDPPREHGTRRETPRRYVLTAPTRTTPERTAP